MWSTSIRCKILQLHRTQWIEKCLDMQWIHFIISLLILHNVFACLYCLLFAVCRLPFASRRMIDSFLFVYFCLFFALCLIQITDQIHLEMNATQCQLLSIRTDRIRTCLMLNCYASKMKHHLIWLMDVNMQCTNQPFYSTLLQLFGVWMVNGHITDTIFTIDLIHYFNLLYHLDRLMLLP